jgi:hypothetical protein
MTYQAPQLTPVFETETARVTRECRQRLQEGLNQILHGSSQDPLGFTIILGNVIMFLSRKAPYQDVSLAQKQLVADDVIGIVDALVNNHRFADAEILAGHILADPELSTAKTECMEVLARQQVYASLHNMVLNRPIPEMAHKETQACINKLRQSYGSSKSLMETATAFLNSSSPVEQRMLIVDEVTDIVRIMIERQTRHVEAKAIAETMLRYKTNPTTAPRFIKLFGHLEAIETELNRQAWAMFPTNE